MILVKDKINYQIRDQALNQVSNQVRKQVWDKVLKQVTKSRKIICIQVSFKIRDQIQKLLT